MNKMVGTVAGGLLAAIMLIGCGKSNAEFDVSSLANDLASQIVYQDDLGEMDIDTASMFMDFSGVDVVKAEFYESSGATAEEIIVMECATSDDATNAEKVLKMRVEEQKESYKDYVPEELKKLDDAIIVCNGKYVVLSVSNDSQGAKKLIDKYMK